MKSLAKLQLFLEIRKRMKKKLNNKVMDDYHQENATSTRQEIFGSAFLEGPECRPTDC